MEAAELGRTRPVRVDGVDEVVISDGLLLHHRGALYRLDRVGAALWGYFDGTVTVEELQADVDAALSDITTGTDTSVARFTSILGEHGLLLI